MRLIGSLAPLCGQHTISRSAKNILSQFKVGQTSPVTIHAAWQMV